MYRQYENPRLLQAQLDNIEAEFADITASGAVDDELYFYYHDKIAELKDRINFAWQDDEYDMAMEV